jgi:hypothetical protein
MRRVYAYLHQGVTKRNRRPGPKDETTEGTRKKRQRKEEQREKGSEEEGHERE